VLTRTCTTENASLSRLRWGQVLLWQHSSRLATTLRSASAAGVAASAGCLEWQDHVVIALGSVSSRSWAAVCLFAASGQTPCSDHLGTQHGTAAAAVGWHEQQQCCLAQHNQQCGMHA
jgi:hypothetical protein